MPCNYSNYPKNWKTEIRPAILKRADNCCEMCGIANHAVGYRDKAGLFHPTRGNVIHDLAGEGISYPLLTPISYKEAKAIADSNNENLEQEERRYIVVVLTIAHLDHDTTNNDYSNLKALCNRCHLRYDIEHHKRNSRATIEKKKALQRLF